MSRLTHLKYLSRISVCTEEVIFDCVQRFNLPRLNYQGLRVFFKSSGLIITAVTLISCTGVQSTGNGASILRAPPPPNFTNGLFVERTGTPLYPLRARNLRVEGWAMVRFSVNAAGNVIPNTIELVNSEPEGFFERSSLVAARDFVFENTANRLVEGVEYVFRYELEEPQVNLIGVRPQTVQVREMIPRSFITPSYPPAAAQQGIGGYVIVEFTVSANGSVADIVIVESQPDGIFDQSALDAARRLRFEPRLVDGEPVTVKNIQYRFDWEPGG